MTPEISHSIKSSKNVSTGRTWFSANWGSSLFPSTPAITLVDKRGELPALKPIVERAIARRLLIPTTTHDTTNSLALNEDQHEIEP